MVLRQVHAIVFASLFTHVAWGAVLHPYVEIDGKAAPAATVQFRQTASQATVSLRVPRDGNYRFGVVLSAAEVSPLAVPPASYTRANFNGPVVLRYPYDWTMRSRNVLNPGPRLVMPGVKADGRVYVVDTHELLSITIQPSADGTHALLLAHRFFNDGADEAASDLHLRKGEVRELTVQIFPEVAAVNRARFGEHLPMKPGNMTQPPFREWASRAFTPQEYTLTAENLQGVYQYAIIREVDTLSWIPPIFHDRGMQAIHYQYLGALRRHSAQVTPAIEREIAMRDAKGQIMTAPVPLNGNWLLGDIRRPEVRARFVENARRAIHAGFDGVFLDGYPFWIDPEERIGGNAPEAKFSWAYARWLLLHEIKAAIRAENPKATLGALANQYFDSLGEADWACKERMYFEWDGKGDEARGTKIRKDLDVRFEEQEAPYFNGAWVYGVKGYSPISVQSSLHFLIHPNGLYYTDAGDFPAAEVERWLNTVRATFGQTDLYIKDIEPAQCWVRFEGQATIQSDQNCTVIFSRPVCVHAQAGNVQPAPQTSLAMKEGARYELDHECSGTAAPARR